MVNEGLGLFPNRCPSCWREGAVKMRLSRLGYERSFQNLTQACVLLSLEQHLDRIESLGLHKFR
jgi:hypothetical protein